MPSISQLSSTATNITQSNTRNDDSDDVDFSQCNDTSDCPPVVGVGDILIEKCSFLRNSFRLPPDVAFQVDCLSVISQHRGNDLNMFNQVMQCVSGHARHQNVDFRTLHVMSRDQLLRYLCQYYRLDFLKPTMHNVTLSDGSLATVPIFDVKETLLAFLNDPCRMRVENIAPNYDPFTGKSTMLNPPLDEIHTGTIWNAACQHYCGNDPNAFPLALVCFYDKTHTDLHGSLACAPFICTPAFLNRDARNDDSNYMVLGYIPNLGYGKGKTKRQTSTMRLQDEHDCLKLITKQIIQIQTNGGFWTEVMGKKVCVKVWIHFITGDTSGHNNLVGHMNGSNMKFPYRDCKCELHELSVSRPKCKLVTLDEIRNATNTPNGLTALSKKAITNAFDGVPFGDLTYGLLGSVPAEMLHVGGTGILKYIFEYLDNLIAGDKDKESFDDLHRQLVKDAQRQSERDFPRMSVRNGITDGTKMCGSERVGNAFILLCLFYTRRGQELIATYRPVSMNSYKECLKLYLSFDRWVNEPHTRREVQNSARLLGELITLIKLCFPRTDGHGWNIPKMHAFAKMPHNMLKFGSANNFCGQIGERALKGIVKDHAQRTQQRPDTFAQQCALREYETNLLRYVMSEINAPLKLSQQTESESTAIVIPKGKFTLQMSATNRSGVGVLPDEVTWHCAKRERLKCGVSDLLTFALRRHSHSNGYSESYKVTGYTSLTINCKTTAKRVIYYASELKNGQKRYDYALVDFVDNDGATQSCPALMLGFIRYDITLGIPTPQFIHEDELSLSDIQQNMSTDNSLYVVVHTASDYIPYEQLQHEFVSTFVLGDVMTCLYVVKIDSIRCPLNVFQNYGADGDDVNKLFCTLPKSEWGQYFTSRI